MSLQDIFKNTRVSRAAGKCRGQEKLADRSRGQVQSAEQQTNVEGIADRSGVQGKSAEQQTDAEDK
jgi:hypothetical protein